MSIQLLSRRSLTLLDVGPIDYCTRRARPDPKKLVTETTTDLASHIRDVLRASSCVVGAVVPFSELHADGAAGGKFNLSRGTFAAPMHAVHVSQFHELPVLHQNSQLLGVDSFTFDAPAGEICARMIFNKAWDVAQAESADIAAWVHEHAHQPKSGVPPIQQHMLKPIAILRSSLTCRYEGPYIPPVRTADETMRLLSLGCDSVIWEEGACGLSARVLENFLKAAAACGVPLSRVWLMLKSNEEVTANCVVRALESGIDRFCGSSCNTARLPPEQQVAPLDALMRTAVYVVDESGDLAESDLTSLEQLEEVCNRL